MKIRLALTLSFERSKRSEAGGEPPFFFESSGTAIETFPQRDHGTTPIGFRPEFPFETDEDRRR